MKTAFFAAALAVSAGVANANLTYHDLSASNFYQDWSNTSLLTTNNDWSGVNSITGYRGDDITTLTGVNPQTLTAFAGPGGAVVNLIANQTNPNTFATGGVAEFEIANPTIALQGSGTADAPFILLLLNTTGRSSIELSYNLRDIDGSTDNAVQQVALQYRIGEAGAFTDIPAGYVADASSGPSLATLVTNISIILPVAAENQSQVQIRIMTTNAVGNDEWIGVDDIGVKSVPTPGALALVALGGVIAGRRRRA